MTKILESNNYSLFEVCSCNRDVIKTKLLEQSMHKHGYITAYPLHVIQNGRGKFIIKAGHHRFEVAKKLGIPVKYVVCDDKATITELERATRKWSLRDYLDSYCNMGKQDYIALKEYCNETNLSVSTGMSILTGLIAGSGGDRSSVFKLGKWAVRTPNHASIITEYLLMCKNLGITCYKTSHFVNALTRILFVKEVDFKILKEKTRKYKMLFEKKLNLDQYLGMFEEVYNRQSRNAIPLKFLSYEISKERQKIVATTK